MPRCRLTDRRAPAAGGGEAVTVCALDAGADDPTTDELMVGVDHVVHVEPALLPAATAVVSSATGKEPCERQAVEWLDSSTRCTYNLLSAASIAS